MRLLLLIPNLILMAIAGYNLYNTARPGYIQSNFTLILLHGLVLLLCFIFIGMIIRSMFVFRYVEAEDGHAGPAYNKVTVQHQ